MQKSIERCAHAKINLALAVAPPRAGDGLHPICSWFAPITLADDVSVERLEAGATPRYTIEWAPDAPRPTPIDWPIEKDLAVRAHRLLEAEVGRSLPIALRVSKRIPTGGGLGGGSSDAASTLRAVVDAFELSIAPARLAAIALTLGSDVPYFLLDPPSAAVVEGVGERIAPAPAPRGDLVLIFPPFGCATGPVYRAFDALPPGPFRAEEVRSMALSADPRGATLFNDLLPAARRVEPALAEIIREAERAAAAPIHMTGSGSTLFAFFERAPQADRAAGAVRRAADGCVVARAALGTEGA